MSLSPHDLGLDRPISRRDLFDGIAVGALGGALGTTAAKPGPAQATPLVLTVGGDTADALSVPHALRDGRFWAHAGEPEPTGERYDLVVVGGGRGGVSAANAWLRRNPSARVLVLDNHDELSWPPPAPSGPPDAVMCDAETFGADTLVTTTGPGWADRLPIAEAARRDLRLLRDDPPDWFPGLTAEGKLERLAELTYSRFLLEVCGTHPDVERFLRTTPSREWGYDTRAFGAVDAWGTGYPGFAGLGLDRDKPSRYNSPTVRRNWHGPVASPEPSLDERARLRLSSPVVLVRDGARSAVVGYFDGHRVATVEAGGVVLACWSAVVPYLVPELPEEVRRALRQAVRVPALHATVRLRDPLARRRLGVERVRWTGAFWCATEFAPPDSVRLVATPCRSKLGPDAGSAAGRRELAATPYEVLEESIRDQLARLLGPVGFDPARDVTEIRIDRWGHAYPPEFCRPWHAHYPDGPFPADALRGAFGRIAVAASDAGPGARHDAAAVAAERAVSELA